MNLADDRLMFAVLVLATHRLARALAVDDISDPIRTRLAVRYGADSPAAQLVSCPHCAGVWFAALAVTAACLFGLVPWRGWPFYVAAVSGGQSLAATLAAAVES